MTPRRKPKRCPGCGREFRPRSGHQMHCVSCLRPKTCTCSRPIPWHDELGSRCVKCGARGSATRPSRCSWDSGSRSPTRRRWLMAERAVTCPNRTHFPRATTHETPAKWPVSDRYSPRISSDREQLVTRHGHELDLAVSALQKSIRRSHVDDACYWAMEMAEAGFDRYLWRRLRIIASEDIGIAEPGLPAVIEALHRTWEDLRKEKGHDETLPTIHAVILLAKARKSRLVCNALTVHAEGDRADLYREPPDWALDRHTRAGRALGRGMAHFYDAASLLADPETGELTAEGCLPDPYREPARELEDGL